MALNDVEDRRLSVIRAARSSDHTDAKTMLEGLVDDDALVREWAVVGLLRTQNRSQAAIELLLQTLRSDDRADLRWYAARALGKLATSTPDVVEALKQSLKDIDVFVRCYSAWAIGRLHVIDADVVEALRSRVSPDISKAGPLEAECVAVALARIHTQPRADAGDLQGRLFDWPTPSQAELPATKDQLLDDLKRAAQTIIEDRLGMPFAAPREARWVMRFIRSTRTKETAVAERGPECQICGFTFRKTDDLWYYESHHVVPLSKGGRDELPNVLVVCANHHRQLHYSTVVWPGGCESPRQVQINAQGHDIRWRERRSWAST